MDSYLDALRMAFSGIFNWVTLVGLLLGILVYGLLSAISTHRENKVYLMRLFGRLQVWLGSFEYSCAKRSATWLWSKIMDLDCARLCQLAMRPTNKNTRLWTIRQLGNFGYNKRIANTCRLIASESGNPKDIAEAARDSWDKTKRHV